MSHLPYTQIDNEETLYRRIPNDEGIIKVIEGMKYVSASAFNDRSLQPSIDRAVLCGWDPTFSQKEIGPDAGVVSVVAQHVRTLSPPIVHGTTHKQYVADAHPDPYPPEACHNHAHALIIIRPDDYSKGVFERIKAALARIAQIEIHPEFSR